MEVYLIGIDGGGTKTDFVLCDPGLNEVARHCAGRSNPNDIGIAQTAALVKSGVCELCAKAGVGRDKVAAAFAGIAGATSRDYSGSIGSALREALPKARTLALHDGINVLYGAFPHGDGISVICGTGSSCFVKKGREVIRIGGYGALDLCGNGYEIGRRALAHALKTVDGREEEGVLEELLHEKYGADFLAALEVMLAQSKDEISALAPLVFTACRRGDTAAKAIIDENMAYIASLIKRASGYFCGGECKAALAGGVMQDPLAAETLAGMIPPGVSLVKSELPPVFGAAARAKLLLEDSEQG
ncbi:MAG: hypothetical protein IK047_03720 [Clostridia bacterium]|nr:hypothetical protein [Clostridia bacterium]